MRWTQYTSMTEALADIPEGQIQNVAHAIPDVYGKALQLYFALRGAYEKRSYHIEEVQLWRGLVTLLALQEHLNLPLSWRKVTLPGSPANRFDAALRRAPDSSKHILFQDKPWDGIDFYVLTWTDKKGAETDLLLYSPFTLVYPVGNWRKVFAALHSVKWYDAGKKRFLPAQEVLNEHEREILYFWLEEAKCYFNSSEPNPAQEIIANHLKQYMEELGVVLNAQDRKLFKLTEIGGSGTGPAELFDNLKQTVRAVLPLPVPNGSGPILTNRIFSDQICYFHMAENPFGGCLNSESYQIGDCNNWYAFLPINPALRAFCGENKPLGKASMRRLDENGNQVIRAALTISGKTYERDYRVVQKAEAGTGLAVPFENGTTDKWTMPVVSVWPNTISRGWKKYYVMLEGSKCMDGSLKVAETPGQEDIHTGDNQYTVQTDYPPCAIPIVRKFTDSGSKVSVGVVIPMLDNPAGSAQLPAAVAVDFGTSSTMMYAQIDGQVTELNIGTDFPLLVTGCDDIRERMMRDYFIPPENFPRGAGTLFSVYRRSGVLKREVEPVIDGVIYQTGTFVDPLEDSKENGKDYLHFNLKWQMQGQKAYYIAFMKQLVLHAAALLYKKGVTSIEWKYSLPESMPPGDRKAVKRIWDEELTPYLEGITEGMTHTVRNQLTESEAASRYFLFQQRGAAHAAIGYLVVDIGGGSTDIALWQGEAKNARMKWHASVKVAGRRMFTHWIKNMLPELCAGVTMSNLEGHAHLIKQTKTEVVNDTLTEILLNMHCSALLDNYQQNCRTRHDGWGRNLYLQISKAVSTLMFALGYQVGALLSTKTFEIPNQLGAFVIAFGGRGAKMLDWIESVDPEDEGSLDSRLKAMFCEGVKAAGGAMTARLQIEISKTPKCEVAEGLLVDEPVVLTEELLDSPKAACVSMDTQKYLDGAERLTRAFETYFGSEPQRLDQDIIAAQLAQCGNKMDQIVNVFMEIIYEGMAECIPEHEKSPD